MKNEKAIVLWESANKGKTTTLNMVASKLAKLQFVPNCSVPTDFSQDSLVVFEKSGKKVVVNTGGDSEYGVNRGLQIDGDIYVLACRTRTGCGSAKQ